MDWFETLTGFRESAVDDVRDQFEYDGELLISKANGRRMRVGRFETPSLAELRAAMPEPSGEPTTVREVVGDVQMFHLMPENAGATFQVASQFNTLEMVSPSITPDAGVTGYAADPTQGPACAVACGAGTIWRNYLVRVDGRRGQDAYRQIDNLADLVAALGTSFTMRNGYALPTKRELRAATRALDVASPDERRAIAERLRVGVQADTEVTLSSNGHTVSQVYGSAVPVGYSRYATDEWEPLARLVLDASYDATLAAARINAAATGNHTVFLTLLGGGVFGNAFEWIEDAIAAALDRHVDAGLDVAIVSHSAPDSRLADLLGKPRS